MRSCYATHCNDIVTDKSKTALRNVISPNQREHSASLDSESSC